jgi:hypothetical protein
LQVPTDAHTSKILSALPCGVEVLTFCFLSSVRLPALSLSEKRWQRYNNNITVTVKLTGLSNLIDHLKRETKAYATKVVLYFMHL